MLAGPVAMTPVVEDNRRGFRFSGRLRAGGLLAGDGTETRHAVMAPTGFAHDASFRLPIPIEAFALAA
jgi:hypothetical protein